MIIIGLLGFPNLSTSYDDGQFNAFDIYKYSNNIMIFYRGMYTIILCIHCKYNCCTLLTISLNNSSKLIINEFEFRYLNQKLDRPCYNFFTFSRTLITKSQDKYTNVNKVIKQLQFGLYTHESVGLYSIQLNTFEIVLIN